MTVLYAITAAGLRFHSSTHTISGHVIAATAGGMTDSCGSLQRLSDGGGQSLPEDYVMQDTNYLLGYADSEHPHASPFCHDAVQ